MPTLRSHRATGCQAICRLEQTDMLLTSEVFSRLQKLADLAAAAAVCKAWREAASYGGDAARVWDDLIGSRFPILKAVAARSGCTSSLRQLAMQRAGADAAAVEAPALKSVSTNTDDYMIGLEVTVFAGSWAQGRRKKGCPVPFFSVLGEMEGVDDTGRNEPRLLCELNWSSRDILASDRYVEHFLRGAAREDYDERKADCQSSIASSLDTYTQADFDEDFAGGYDEKIGAQCELDYLFENGFDDGEYQTRVFLLRKKDSKVLTLGKDLGADPGYGYWEHGDTREMPGTGDTGRFPYRRVIFDIQLGLGGARPEKPAQRKPHITESGPWICTASVALKNDDEHFMDDNDPGPQVATVNELLEICESPQFEKRWV